MISDTFSKKEKIFTYYNKIKERLLGTK
jgi:hypothetical protein